jgi:hypothetical protein
MRFVLRTNVVPHLKGEMWGTRLLSVTFGSLNTR